MLFSFKCLFGQIYFKIMKDFILNAEFYYSILNLTIITFDLAELTLILIFG